MSDMKTEWISKQEVKKRTWVSLLFFLIFLSSCILGWKWLYKQPRDNGAYKPLRTVLNKNEDFFKSTLTYNQLTKTFTVEDAVKTVRVNGKLGLKNDLDTAHWELRVVSAKGDTLHLLMNDIKALPKTEIIFDFKCVEGWSQVTHWGGVRFDDFVKKYHLEEEAAMNYVGLSTPDRGYYVGIDSKSMNHPQTILCYEMNGAPLPLNQGYPLRLIIPVKYGIKHIKRIGTIYFSNTRPPDYWYEKGYDYFAGL